MTYEQLCDLEDKASKAFLNVLEDAGINRAEVSNALDNKDCYNDVSDAIISCIEIKDEE